MASSKVLRIIGSSSMPMPMSMEMTNSAAAPIRSQNEMFTSWGTPIAARRLRLLRRVWA